MDAIRQAHDEILKRAIDQGKLLEAGFAALRVQVFQGASEPAVNVARLVYMAGAQHLFASFMAMLDPDREPTVQDMRRMSLIAAELQAIEPELNALVAGEQKGPAQ